MDKLNTIATAAFSVLFTFTGFLLWYGVRDTRFRFANTLLIHDWLMDVSVILFAGHASRQMGRTVTRLPDRLSVLGIAGGAVYDALVALAAIEHDAELATRDARAKATYDTLGTRVTIAG